MIEFRTSSFCSLGNCVEVGRTSDGDVALRDSKNLEQAPMVFTPGEWSAFVAGIKNSEFDLG